MQTLTQSTPAPKLPQNTNPRKTNPVSYLYPYTLLTLHISIYSLSKVNHSTTSVVCGVCIYYMQLQGLGHLTYPVPPEEPPQPFWGCVNSSPGDVGCGRPNGALKYGHIVWFYQRHCE